MLNREKSCRNNDYKNFFCKADKVDNLFDLNKGMTYKDVINQYISLQNKKSPKDVVIHFPINLAAEFQPISKTISINTPLKGDEIPSKLLTVQMCLLSMDSPEKTLVYSITPKPEAKLIKAELDFIPLQLFIEELDFEVKILHGRDWYEAKTKHYPTLNIVIYCFSGKQSIFKLFRRYTLDKAKSQSRVGGAGLQELLKQVKSGFLNESNSYLHAGNKTWLNQSIELPYLLIAPIFSTDSGCSSIRQKFKVSVEFIDVCAIHGNGKDLSEVASNVKSIYIPKINKEDEDNIQDIYERDWERFLGFAKSKCIYYDILVKYNEKMQTVYHDLSVPDFKPPKLTIGATVRNLLKSAVINKVKQVNPEIAPIKIKDLVEKLMRYGSSKHLQALFENEVSEKFRGKQDRKSQKEKQNRLNEKLLLTKVIGGRTCCGQPLYISKFDEKEVICDSDIKQAYPTVIKQRELPLGYLEVVRDIPLKEYIEKHRGNAAENLELVYVTVEGGELPESQNFLPSVTYRTSKYLNEEESIEPSDTRIYTHQVIQSPFTTSTFYWLDYVATPQLRKYIKENGKVLIGGYYPKDKFVPLENLAENLDTFDEEQKWTKVALGEILVNKLIKLRSENKKKSQGGTDESEAMNNLYKLMNNTIYGAFSSRNFDICNPIVANNVTSDVRLMVWCLETALGGFQTITDGVSWCLNRVLVGRNTRYKPQPLHSRHHLVHRLPCQTAEERCRQGWNWAAIGNAKSYQWRDADILELRQGESSFIEHCQMYDDDGKPKRHPLLKCIDEELIPKHIKACFPKDFIEKFIDKLKFEVESKGLYTSLTTDGAANYLLTPPKSYPKPDNEPIIKRRSHKTKQGKGKEVFTKYYLQDICHNPERVTIPMPYTDYEMVSCGDYKQRYESHYKYSILIPGDYEPKVKSFQAFQLYQFTFRTHDQYEKFRKEHGKARKKYGLSAERYHLCLGENGEVDNDNCHINYKQMLEEYDSALCPQKVKRSSDSKLYPTYRSYQNGKNRTRLRKYGSLLPAQTPKQKKDKLNEESRRLFDYEQSYSEEFSLMSDGSISVRVKGKSLKSST
ncbi:hypothetical protein NDI37_09805 [Funiculus sociatus GB2-A5]|uniref:DNA-directed DNA polymerase n=1 Tax=Funiculus sociatus GB2-A5 TaxID=2933946 RepID=A0ABV0JMX8_9CYAN|nr:MULTISPECIES: hypothetical protein [unclassified Trichocoleus]MBD1907796.1 hypothetical protein [Trichocoleus sp. FACHB-832]MBD2063974.1 hypothetical protein [Trichocoleus sp. FACHB-6]